MVRDWLKDTGLALRKIRKVLAGGTSPYRDAQFQRIAALKTEYVEAGNPVLSFDSKAKEHLGQLFRKVNAGSYRVGPFARHRASTAVYLRSTPEELYRRLRHDTQRPLLQVRDPLRRLRDLYAERDPFYRQTAHFVIETGRPSIATLVNMILMQLELAGLVDSAQVPSPIERRPTVR